MPGASDDQVAAAEANWIVQQLGSKLLMFDGTGHHPHIDCAEQITQVVEEFAASLPALPPKPASEPGPPAVSRRIT